MQSKKLIEKLVNENNSDTQHEATWKSVYRLMSAIKTLDYVIDEGQGLNKAAFERLQPQIMAGADKLTEMLNLCIDEETID